MRLSFLFCYRVEGLWLRMQGAGLTLRFRVYGLRFLGSSVQGLEYVGCQVCG